MTETNGNLFCRVSVLLNKLIPKIMCCTIFSGSITGQFFFLEWMITRSQSIDKYYHQRITEGREVVLISEKRKCILGMKQSRYNKLGLTLTNIYIKMFVLPKYWSVSCCSLSVVIWLNSKIILFFLPLQYRHEDFLECSSRSAKHCFLSVIWEGKHFWPLKI